MSPVRTVLLDLDGTLVDSAALITEHLAGALVAVGAEVPEPAVLRSMVGPPFETAMPAIGLSAEQTAAAIVLYRRTYDLVAARHTPLYAGVPELLDKLAAAGRRLVVATSKPETTARRIVDGVGIADRFALVAGADHVLGRVGKGAVIGSALDRLGLDPRTTPVVMVGDRHHDVDGAAEYSVPAIGVGWGYAEPGELAGARLIVDDLETLLVVLTDDEAPIWSS
ncbi:MAG: HAD hydrolase-like protein [Pseudonocardiales bacterium]|nr:HAD hydrolase-like protein [Pseudonocardiales bacterium]